MVHEQKAMIEWGSLFFQGGKPPWTPLDYIHPPPHAIDVATMLSVDEIVYLTSQRTSGNTCVAKDRRQLGQCYVIMT